MNIKSVQAAVLCGLFLAGAALVALSGYHDAASGMALAAVVQSAYASRMEPAVAGMWANMTNWDADTRTCETAAGIGFGVACGQGTADKGVVLGGALALFVGVSIRDITLVNTVADKYADNQNVALANEGDIWVQTSATTAPADAVHYDADTGIFATSGGSGPIVGARWMETRAAGLGLLRLSGHMPVP